MRRALALLTVVLLLAGCAGKSNPQAVSSPSAATPTQNALAAAPYQHYHTFTSRRLYFSLTYDGTQVAQGIMRSTSEPGYGALILYYLPGPPMVDLSPLQPYGPGGGLGVEAVAEDLSPGKPPLSVARASASKTYLAASDLPSVRVATMKRKRPHFALDAVDPVTLNGVPGYRVRYSWTGGSTETLLLYKGAIAYTLTVTLPDKAATFLYGQALYAALRSFKVTLR